MEEMVRIHPFLNKINDENFHIIFKLILKKFILLLPLNIYSPKKSLNLYLQNKTQEYYYFCMFYEGFCGSTSPEQDPSILGVNIVFQSPVKPT